MSARLRAVAEANKRIVRDGWYTAADGTEVTVGPAIEAAAAATRLHDPGPLPTRTGSSDRTTVFEVTGEDSLAAARRLTEEAPQARTDAAAGARTAADPTDNRLRGNVLAAGVGPTGPNPTEHGAGRSAPAVLVFASARNPGGGYVNGAKAQEEALCRASALYHCLLRVPEFYAAHREVRDPFYSDRVIHSPGVPVFRDTAGKLLARPFAVGFLTSPAPNAGVVARQLPIRMGEIPAVLTGRAERVLEVAAAGGYRQLVLGAWGCGVFRNDPAHVASAFAVHLTGAGRFAASFDRVVLAIRDRETSPARLAFNRVFRG